MRKMYVIVGFVVLLLSMIQLAQAHYNYEMFSTITDPNSKYFDDAYASDLDTGTYCYVKPTDAITYYLYFNQTNKDFSGVRFYCSIDLSTNYNILVQYDTGSSYTTIYNGVATANSWVSATITTICNTDVNVRIKLNSATGREFRIKEFQLIDYYNNPPAILSQYTDYPFGDGCYGLCPDILVTIKDNDAGDTSLLELYGSKDDVHYTLLERNDSGESVAQINYTGCYFNRYNQPYYLKICRTDNLSTCGVEWVNQTFLFKILPCILDKSDPLDTLPFEGDCWEMVSIPCNVSKYDVMIYNISDSSWQSWNASKGTGHYDGVFWWNSSDSSYDNVTDLEVFKGYWIYFYDANFTVRYNCTCDCPECNSTVLTLYENIVSATGTHESQYNSTTGWKVWANYTGTDGCSGWYNYTDDNVTVNVSLSVPGLFYEISEDAWLYVSGLSLDPSLMLFVFIGFFYYFATKKKSYVLYALSVVTSLIAGVYFIGWEVDITSRILGISLILFAIYCSYEALVSGMRIEK